MTLQEIKKKWQQDLDMLHQDSSLRGQEAWQDVCDIDWLLARVEELEQAINRREIWI